MSQSTFRVPGISPILRGVGQRGWRRRTHLGLGLIVLPVVAVVFVVGGIRQYVDAQPFHHGVTTTATFENVTGYTTYSRSGTHHHHSGDLDYVRTDGTSGVQHVHRAGNVVDGQTETVSYRPGHAGARWVDRGDAAWSGLVVAGIVAAVSLGYLAVIVVGRRRGGGRAGSGGEPGSGSGFGTVA